MIVLPDASGQLTAVFTGVSAVFLGASAWFLYRASKAPREIYQEQRRDAMPEIVVEARDTWQVEVGTLPYLAFKPTGPTGGIVAGATIGTPTPRGPQQGLAPTERPQSRLLLQVTNVGGTAAVGLRIPLRCSFAHLGRDPNDLANPETLGLKREVISHECELTIAALPPGEYLAFLVNETGVPVTIESTGEAYDIDPRTKETRTLSAASPTPIVLRATE